MNIFTRSISRILIIVAVLTGAAMAGQTGKLAGTVVDSETGEPIIGANILIEGTYYGAAADIEGYYYINNIQPGNYTVIASAVGYNKITFTDVLIKIDLTRELNIEMTSQAIEMGDVVVTAEKPLVQKDLTSTSVTVSSQDIELMPVESVNEVVNLQAGVIGGHFRGGRSNEVAYLIDGIPVNDVYNNGVSVEVENSSVRALEVISGTFNAEYGRAMSGVVNIVTKEGGKEFEGSLTAYVGDHITTDDDLFYNLDNVDFNGVRDIQFSLSGPTYISEKLTFFATGRFFNQEGHLYGQRVYNIEDEGPFQPTGDSSFVPMNPYDKISTNAKLTWSEPSWKVSYSIFWDDNENKYYDHGWRWSPDGLMNHFRENFIQNLQIALYPSQATFITLKGGVNQHYYKGYLYEDPFDERYINPRSGIPTSGYTYRYGGNQVGRYSRSTRTYLGQIAAEWQVSKEHKVKLGGDVKFHKLFDHYREIVNLTEGQVDDTGKEIFTLGYRQFGTPGNQGYDKSPYEFSGYIQDKMEYDIMIINAGLRFDYFNANTTMPSDLRNPSRNASNPNFPGAGESVTVDPKFQVSPRLGVSFPITDQGAIYFSYGHFFQMPTFENLYTNNEYIINQSQSLSSITGNPDLEAQKTIKYELGLQQVIAQNLALDLTVYYSDVRNQLGMEILNTYEGFKYGRFINKDYANIRGVILSIDRRFADFFGFKVDYTYQVAEGNSSDPFSVYNDNQTNPPVESEKKVVPLNWDQRSTLNLSATIGQPGDWTAGIIFRYGSGQPYTEDIRISNGVRFENGGSKPPTYNLDLKIDKVFKYGGFDFFASLLVYNVLDIRNEYGVYATTGRANSDLDTKFAGEVNGLNSIDEYVANPAMYGAPREVRLGLRIGF